MILPSTIANFLGSSDRGWLRDSSRQVAVLFDPGNYPYQIGYFLLVVGFTFFYTIVVFNQQNIPENLQKNGGFVPGIRPGRPTAEYLIARPEPDHARGRALPRPRGDPAVLCATVHGHHAVRLRQYRAPDRRRCGD